MEVWLQAFQGFEAVSKEGFTWLIHKSLSLKVNSGSSLILGLETAKWREVGMNNHSDWLTRPAGLREILLYYIEGWFFLYEI